MNSTECLERREQLARFLEADDAIPIENLDFLGKELYSLANKVALPCLPAARFGIDRESPILDVPIELEGELVGLLCLSSRLRDSGIELAAVTDAQKHAIVRLASSDDFDRGGETLLKQDFDCVVIDKHRVERFLENRSTSAIWGGFVLQLDEIPLERSLVNTSSAKINVVDLASPRTTRHRAALQRSTETPIVVDRFLHLYHFLELDYDHEIVRRISGIDQENTRGLEKLLGTGRSELDRLHLVCDGFSEINELERIAGLLGSHRDPALAVFYDYGKDHNPLRDRTAFERQFLETPIVSRAALDAIKRTYGLDSNFAKDEFTYNDMLIKLACYWTYRIRCCIAHNKLGEYHLRTASDMGFVADFGEPLITALIAHRLKQQRGPRRPRNGSFNKEFRRRILISRRARQQ